MYQQESFEYIKMNQYLPNNYHYNINIVGISILAVDSVVLDPYYQFDILSTANNNILLMI